MSGGKPWWKKKRWAAALAVWIALPVLYLVSEGPGVYLAWRGYIPASAYLAAMKPIAYSEPWLPTGVNQLRTRWIAWWMATARASD